MHRIDLGPNFSEVIEAAALGEEWAWSAVYQAIAGPVTCFLRISGAESPLDLAGDVFFRIARSIQRFEGDESAFRTFIFVTAMNELRRAEAVPGWHRSNLADVVLSELQEQGRVEPDEQLVREVEAALELLERDQRDVMNLRIVAGLSVSETADVVGKGVRKVRAIQRRAMSRLSGAPGIRGAVR